MPKYIVWQAYFGLIDTKDIICFCNDLADCKSIIDGLLLLRKGRPFTYRVTLFDGSSVPAESQLQYDEFFDEVDDYTAYCSDSGISSL